MFKEGDSSNRQERNFAPFKQNYGKIWDGARSYRFYFNANRKSLGSSKKAVLVKWALFKRYVYFYVTIAEVLNVFNILTLEKPFWKTKSLSLKTRELLFSWKYCDWKCNVSIQNCPVKANIKKNKMVQNKAMTKNEVLPITASLF